MIPDPRCPTPDALRALLEDRLPSAEQAAFAAHLEECEACRAAMEGLAAESRLWGEVRGLAEGVGHRDDTRETHEAPPVDDGHPGFLDPPDPEQPEQIGRFGPYAVHGVIGRGGWGVVLKGFDPSLHRPIAIKVLAPQYATSATARRRFVREARAAASISHDHVVTIHAVDEWKGLPYLVMQYVAGKSLQERIDRTGPLEVKEVLRIGMQAARGLAAAHAQGLIHRDVKPANILLENGIERVKLTDFGLARAVDDASLTQSGLVAGTPQYMAPEQARGEAVDHRADLFSLGGVLYAMATGHSPFRGRSTMAVLRRVCDEAPRPVREANPDIPEELAAVIHRLLAKDPAERYSSASEVADVLASQLARRQHAAPTVDLSDVGPAKSSGKATAFRRHRHAREYAVVAAGMLMVLVVANPFGVASPIKELLQTVLRIRSGDGTLVLKVDDPSIKVRVDGEDVVLNDAGPNEIRLHPGDHNVQAATRDGREAGVVMTIERGHKQVASVHYEPDGRPGIVVGDRNDLKRSQPRPSGSVVPDPMVPPHPPIGVAALDVAEPPAAPATPAPPAVTLPGGNGSIVVAQADGLPRPELLRTIETRSPVSSLAFPIADRVFAMTGPPARLIVADPYGMKRVHGFEETGEGSGKYAMALAPGGEAFALGYGVAPTALEFYRYVDDLPKNLWLRKGYRAGITAIAISPDGRLVAAGDQAGNLKLWDAATGKMVRDLTDAGHDGTPITHLVFFKDGRGTNGMSVLLVADWVVGDRGFGIRLFDVEAGQAAVSRTLDVTGGARGPDFHFRAECLAVAPDGKSLFVGVKGGGIRFYDLMAGGSFRRIFGDVAPTALAFTPDGKALIAGNEAGNIDICDPATGRPAPRFDAHRGRVRALAVAPDGKAFATSGDDNMIKLWALVAPSAPPVPAALLPAVPVAPPATNSNPANADDPRRDATIELARSLVDQAERRLAEAEVAREQAEGDAASVKQEVTVAEKALVAREDAYKRVSQLAAHQAIEQHLVDEEREHFDEAAAAVRLAKNRALLAEAKVPAAEARLAMARAEKDIARLNLQALEHPAPGYSDQQRRARAQLAVLDVEVALGDRSVASKAVEVARAASERQVADRKYRETASARVRDLVAKNALEPRLADEERAKLEVARAAEKARAADLTAAESRLKLAERRVREAEKRLNQFKDGEVQRREPAKAAGSSSTR